MKIIPAFFRFARKRYRLIRIFLVIIFLVSCAVLFLSLPEQYRVIADPEKAKGMEYTVVDRCIVVFQVAKGNLSDIYGPKVSFWVQAARLALPFVLAWATIEAIIHFFIRFFTALAIRYLFVRHVVVFGIGEKGLALAKELLQRGHVVVAIDKNAANPYLEQLERRGAFVLCGDATDEQFLKTLGLQRAEAFYAMTGDDTVNIESAICLKKRFQKKGRTCWDRFWNYLCGNYGNKDEIFSATVQVHDPVLRRLAWEKNGPFSQASITDNTAIPWACYPFSAYDQAAKIVVEKFSPDVAVGSTKPCHVVIVGFGWLGERIALQVIRMCQFPRSQGRKPVIHVIDNQADFSREQFYRRYPAVDPGNADDPRYSGYVPLAEMNFIQGDIRRMNEQSLKVAIPELGQNAVIYVCLADELLGVEAAVTLAEVVRESGSRIVFALPETERLSGEMQHAFQPYGVDMFFPLSSSCFLAPSENHLGETLDTMGKAVLKAYYRSTTVTEVEKSWSESPEWGRESNRQSASHVFFKLRMAGVEPERIETIGREEVVEICKEHRELLAEAEHDRWCAERLLDGWVYGEEKDVDKRLHPDIKPFSELTDQTKDIDIVINDVIPDVLAIWQQARRGLRCQKTGR